MQLEEAQLLWTRDASESRFTIDEATLHAVVKRNSRRLARQTRSRDWLEPTIGVLAGFVFMIEGFVGGRTIHWDWLTLAAGCWFVSAIFVRERTQSRERPRSRAIP